LLIVGVFNARCATLQSSPLGPSRKSHDQTKANSRGNNLVEAFASSRLAILNGSVGTDAVQGGRYTSFQSSNTVIDYMAFNVDDKSDIKDFWVGDRCESFDHAPIFVILKVGAGWALHNGRQMHRPNGQPPIASPTAEAHERQYRAPHVLAYGICLATGGDPWKIVAAGYVQEHSSGNPKKKRAGAGTYVGPASDKFNCGERVPDKQNERRANLYAVLLALFVAPDNRPVHILVPSAETVFEIQDRIGEHTRGRWKLEDGDIVRAIAAKLSARERAVHFFVMKEVRVNLNGDGDADGCNCPLRGAKEMAMNACYGKPRKYIHYRLKESPLGPKPGQQGLLDQNDNLLPKLTASSWDQRGQFSSGLASSSNDSTADASHSSISYTGFLVEGMPNPYNTPPKTPPKTPSPLVSGKQPQAGYPFPRCAKTQCTQ
jgi:ribonuclease HI